MAKPSLLIDAEIRARLERLDGWSRQAGGTFNGESSGEISRSFQFKDFKEALLFTNAVGWLAERADHHPDFDLRYNRVKLALSTHSAGGLTAKDFDLAEKINDLV